MSDFTKLIVRDPMIRRRVPGLPAMVLLVLIACGPGRSDRPDAAPGEASGTPWADQPARLDSMWSGISDAMQSGDTAALAAYYADSAYFAETGSPTLRGRSAILAATEGVFACCRYLESHLEVESTELVGNRALQFGTYRDVIQPQGQAPLAMYGRFDAVLERSEADRWRVRRLVIIRDSTVALSEQGSNRP